MIMGRSTARKTTKKLTEAGRSRQWEKQSIYRERQKGTQWRMGGAEQEEAEKDSSGEWE